MAHYKRRSQRRDKQSWYPCGCCTKPDLADTKAPQIEENEICNDRPRKKKPRAKKEKCPAGKAHLWYKETVSGVDRVYRYSIEDFEDRPYSYELWTCLNCWTTKKPHGRGNPWRRRRRRYSNASWRPYKLELPKRKVTLY